jgi:hypothetical protein
MDIFSYLLGKKTGGGGGGGSNLDWTKIGYEGMPPIIEDDYNYSLQIYNNWTPSASLRSKFASDKNLVYMPLVNTSTATDMYNMFQGCQNLSYIPLLDTGNVTNMIGLFDYCQNITKVPLFDTKNVTMMNSMFSNCVKLIDIPVFDTKKLTDAGMMFYNCTKLSDQSLDNILQMCINATSYTKTKTLNYMYVNSTAFPASKIQSLPHYQEFVEAGWSIGY